MNQAVIFDLDGVIIDSEPIHFEIEKKMFRELDIDISKDEHEAFVGTSTLNMWESIVNRNKVSGDPGELTRRNHAIYIQFLQQNQVKPMEGVKELIEDLQKHSLVLMVASSSPMEVIETVLKKFKLSHFFKGLVSGAELQHSKPHPEIFLKAAGLAACRPSACVVIEDSTNGVQAAIAAGMKCIGYLNPGSGTQNLDGSRIIIDSFSKIDANFIRNLE